MGDLGEEEGKKTRAKKKKVRGRGDDAGQVGVRIRALHPYIILYN